MQMILRIRIVTDANERYGGVRCHGRCYSLLVKVEVELVVVVLVLVRVVDDDHDDDDDWTMFIFEHCSFSGSCAP